MGMNRNRLREALHKKRFEWRRHVLERLTERSISQQAVIDVLVHGEEIEDYPGSKFYPSALFLAWVEGRPLHVVASLDEEGEYAYIITTYEPGLDTFEPGFRTRRKQR